MAALERLPPENSRPVSDHHTAGPGGLPGVNPLFARQAKPGQLTQPGAGPLNRYHRGSPEGLQSQKGDLSIFAVVSATKDEDPVTRVNSYRLEPSPEASGALSNPLDA